jgi:hypothetical protein
MQDGMRGPMQDGMRGPMQEEMQDGMRGPMQDAMEERMPTQATATSTSTTPPRGTVE